MSNWIELSNKEETALYRSIYKFFNFSPSMDTFPSFVVPSPFITYDISIGSEDMNQIELLCRDLEIKTLHNLKEVTKENEFIYGFDWNHVSYWINPHLEFLVTEGNEWLIPVYPDGDYYFFLQKDFNWGILGHPWEKSITIFGSDLLQAFREINPIMLRKVLREG